MAASPDPKALTIPTRRYVAGEPMVWLTAMGLTLSLTLVFFLLCVVVWNGLGVFWPSRVMEFTIDQGGKHEVFLGIEVKRQLKRAPGKAGVNEIQIFTGNKENYNGQAFQYFDVSSITTRTPEGVMLVERMERGHAIGQPVELRIKGEAPLKADEARFDSRLAQLIGEVAARREEIKAFEKGVIGRGAQKIKELEDEKRAMTATKRLDPARFKQIDEKIAELNKDFIDNLDPKRKAMRAQQDDHQLVLKLASSEEKIISLGGIIDTVYPNKLSVVGQLGRFLRNAFLFVWEDPREANTEGGIFPAIVGTFVMTILMSVAVVPFGVLAAIYLREYAKQGLFVRIVRISVNNLAGVPSIVFGVFGLGFFVYIVGGSIDSFFYPGRPDPVFGTGAVLWASLTLALMTVPVVIVATEESIASVPRGMREGSLACGASKWQTIQRIVLPASIPGILTGLILAMARGAGEVAPLMLVGVVKLAPALPVGGDFPFLHLDYKFMHLGFHIYDVGFQSPDSEAAKPMVFATTLVLILLVLALNLSAIMIRERLRRKYATGAF